MKLLRRPRIFRLQTFSAALALCVAGYSAHAASYNWDPTATASAAGGGPGVWNLTNAFWYNGTADVAWPDSNTSTNADTAIFGGTAGTGAVTTGAAIGVNSIVFNTAGYNISNGTGFSLTLIGANPTIVNNTTGTDTIGATLNGTAGFTRSGTGTVALTSTGTIALTGAGAAINNTGGTTTLSAPINLSTGGAINVSAGSLQIGNNSAPTTGIISGGTSGQTVINVTNGAGLILNGNNTYNGVTNLGSSLLAVGNNSTNYATALGASGAGNGTIVANGGGVRYQNAANVTIAESFQISGAGGGNGALSFYNATGNMLSGAITLSGDSAILLRSNVANRSNTIGGVISEAAGGTSAIVFSRFNAVTTASVDSYVLAAANTYAGNTFITDAANSAGGSGTAATTATSYFQVQANVNNALPTTTVLTLGGQQTVQGTTVGSAAGAGRFILNGVNQTVAGLTTAGTAGALNVVAGGSATTLSTLTVNNAATAYTFSGILGATTTGGNNLALVKSGAGTFTLSGANTYAGGTTITGGTLIVANNSALGTGNVELGTATNLTINAGIVITNMTGTTLTLDSATNSTVNLLGTGVQDTVAALVINGVNQLAGTYGAVGSGATFMLPDFTGTGQLLVAVPEPGTWALFGVGVVGLGLALRRRTRTA